MKPTTASALPILAAVVGIVAAVGAVSKSAADYEGGEAALMSKRDRGGAAAPAATLATPERSAVATARPEAEPAPEAAWTQSSKTSTARRSEVVVPRTYRPTLQGQDIDEADLGRNVASLVPLERHTIEGLRMRYLALPSRIEQSLLGRELPPEDFSYEQALAGLCDEIEEILVASHKDYYANNRFPYTKVGETPLTERPVGNSQFTTKGLYVVGDWYVDAGFRSADYPSLQAKLEAAMRLQLEREDFLDRALNVR